MTPRDPRVEDVDERFVEPEKEYPYRGKCPWQSACDPCNQLRAKLKKVAAFLQTITTQTITTMGHAEWCEAGHGGAFCRCHVNKVRTALKEIEE